MSGISACVLGGLILVHAPVPPEPVPDPLARGYMGIRAMDKGLMIESVEPNGPAIKAGLKAQDVIVRVGLIEPQEFEQVKAYICSFRPGSVVEIEVLRGAERKVFKVKLAARPPELDYHLPIDPPMAP